MASFLQWNVRGLRANREDLSILLADTNPTAVCLQETFLTADKTMKFNNYTTYCMPAVEANGTPHGGVEDFLLKHNLSVLNDGSPTYLHPATGSLSAIDLSITDPSLYIHTFICIRHNRSIEKKKNIKHKT